VLFVIEALRLRLLRNHPPPGVRTQGEAHDQDAPQ